MAQKGPKMARIALPRDLRTAGRTLLRGVVAYLDTEKLLLDTHEEVVLIEACRTADRLAQLREVLAGMDLTESAAVRLLAEERQQRTALAHLLLTKLGLPTGVVGASGAGATPRSRRGQTGARNRWGDRAS